MQSLSRSIEISTFFFNFFFLRKKKSPFYVLFIYLLSLRRRTNRFSNLNSVDIFQIFLKLSYLPNLEDSDVSFPSSHLRYPSVRERKKNY